MEKSPVYLRCFGGIALERDGVPLTGRATQRRRLAVLIILAASPSRLVTRDKLMALLWPESDADAARHLLAGAVYELRRALGEQAIRSRGYDLWLDPAWVKSDVADFENALAAGQPEPASALYGGPFADGFFVSAAPEFERWLEDRRDGYRRAYRLAIRAAAERRSRAGEHAAAASLWLRAIEDDRADANALLEAMRALENSGERAEALRQAALYDGYVRTELGSEPAAEVAAFAAGLRETHIAVATSNGAPPASVGTIVASSARMKMAMPKWLIAAGATTATITLLLGLGTMRDTPAPAHAGVSASGRIVVLPFTVSASPSHAELRDGVAELLSAALDGAGELRAVRPDAVRQWLRREPQPAGGDAAASHFGAAYYVTGSVRELAGRLQLTAELRSRGAATEPVSTATVAGDVVQIFDLVDRLVAQLLASGSAATPDRLARVAARTTHSLAALKAYLQGEREYNSGRFAAAAEAFQQAVVADSTFALAYYRQSMATLAADLPGADATAADERALRHSARLSDHDRLLVAAYSAYRRGAADRAEQLYRNLLAVYPDDTEAWSQLGETYFHYNPIRGRPIAEARAPFERVLSENPENWQALWHLALIAALDGRRDDAVSLLDRLLALRPESAQAVEVRTLRALMLDGHAAVSRLSAELLRSDELKLHDLVWRSAVFLGNIDAAQRLAHLLTDARRPKYARYTGHHDLAYLHLARGQRRAAYVELGRAALFHEWDYSAAIAAMLFPRPSLAELAALRAGILDTPLGYGESRETRHFTLGMLSIAIGDTVNTRRQLAALESFARADGNVNAEVAASYSATLRARAALSRGDANAALAALDGAILNRWFGTAVTSVYQAQTAQRFTRAEALYAAGRASEAWFWYASFGEHAPHDLIFLGPSHLRRAQIAEAAGKRELAVRHYQRFIELWKDCDADLQPLVAAARRKLELLN